MAASLLSKDPPGAYSLEFLAMRESDLFPVPERRAPRVPAEPRSFVKRLSLYVNLSMIARSLDVVGVDPNRHRGLNVRPLARWASVHSFAHGRCLSWSHPPV